MTWIGWHRLACFASRNEHPKGSAISVTSENLRDNLWAEMARWQNESPFLLNAFQWNKERITAKDHPETWFLAAKGWAKSADLESIGRTLSGQHARYPFYLIDESGDIPPNMIKSAEQGLTSCEDGLIITAGNTTSQTGLLYEVSTRGRSQLDEDGRPLWDVISITGDPDDPKRAPRVQLEWAKQQIALYGRENPWVMAMVLGQFPPGSINALLSADEVERAMNLNPRPETYQWAQKRLGLDVARYGDDRSVLFPRQGIAAFEPRVMRHPRDSAVSVNLASAVMVKKMEWALRDDLLGEEEILTFLDDTVGWAHGAVDVLRAAGHNVYAILFSSPAGDPRYKNMRAEMWMRMADWVKAGGSLPNIPELIQEMSAPTYFFNAGQFQLESKEQIKKRLGKSPDLADALALTFALPERPGGLRLPGMGQRQTPQNYDPYAILG